jgi:hypothetical protein
MGSSVLMWHDKWKNTVLKEKFPHPFSFAKKITLINIFNMLNLPLSMIATQQFDELAQDLNSLSVDNSNEHDK